MDSKPLFSFALSLALCTGCIISTGGRAGDGDDDDDGAGPSGQEVAHCQSSCDQLKLFDCNDSLEQAACYDACDDATSAQIRLFNGCVDNDICDPTCSPFLQGNGGEGEGENGGGGEGEGEGELGTDEGGSCVEACDDLLFFECITAGQQGDCRDVCDGASESDADQFVACVGASSCDAECYYELNPSAERIDPATEFEISVCEGGCDSLVFWDCVDASGQAECRDLCATKSGSAVTQFSDCQGSSGSDCSVALGCLDVLRQE